MSIFPLIAPLREKSDNTTQAHRQRASITNTENNITDANRILCDMWHKQPVSHTDQHKRHHQQSDEMKHNPYF